MDMASEATKVDVDRGALLYLCHRIPYPPDKGDKIRSYHLLRYLRQRFRIYLGAFVDDPADWQHADYLRTLCDEVYLVPLRPLTARLRSLPALMRGEALSVPYYCDRRMSQWVDQVCSANAVDRAIAFSSPMAQYLNVPALRNATCVVDFVDVDSDKWAQYAQHKPAWEAWVYRRESRRLAHFEHRVAERVYATTLVSQPEVDLFKARRPESTATVLSVPNGVDTDFFCPDENLESPYPADEKTEIIAFTGAMDYWANADAVTWFVEKVLPGVLEHRPKAQFYIVGSNPSPQVKALTSDHVTVTGRVADVRPYLQHAEVIVAPMRIARGVQNKVLEAMAMAKPVVTTDKGLEGLEAKTGEEIRVAVDARAFAREVVAALAARDEAIGNAARRRVIEDYSWRAALAPFQRLLA